jgi:hypothetical protein
VANNADELATRTDHELLAHADSRARQVNKYVRAYRQAPETAADERSARTSAHSTLSALEWDDE